MSDPVCSLQAEIASTLEITALPGPGTRSATRRVTLLSIAAAAALWFAVVVATGEADAMSHVAYLIFVLPGLAVVAATLGWFFGSAAWASGLWMMLAHAVIGALSLGIDGSLLPVGVLIFVTLALVLSAIAWAAARVARALRDRAARRSTLE